MLAERVRPPLLSRLVARLGKGGPLSISGLVQVLGHGEVFQEFRKLVRQYLPEQEMEILSERNEEERAEAFCAAFSQRYFPIGAHEYDFLVARIPVLLHGLSGDDYHSVDDWRPEFLLLGLLAQTPYIDDARVYWLEVAQDIVAMELLERIPDDGYSPAGLAQLLMGSRFEPALLVGEIINHSTGNALWDVDEEMGAEYPEWGREEVEHLTELWGEFQARDRPLNDLLDWLREDLPAHFEQLLDFIDFKLGKGVPHEQLKLPI